jgi:RNA polymerase sigma-70 factor (ECF subfamily)
MNGATEEELLAELRPTAFAIAYRMLGSVAEAEDIVQEALLRTHAAIERGERIESPRAFVGTVTSRLAIDHLRSARVRREQYIGEWLPEPLVADASPGPAEKAEIADSLSTAFLVLLESLSPEQRAALLLHDVFDYGYGEVAEIVGTNEANARQLASRARRQVGERRPRFRSSEAERDELADRFFEAVDEGDLAGLESLLADDVVLRGDGGGKVPALARAISGRTRVARTLRNWSRLGLRTLGISFRRETVNGGPGAVAVDNEGRVVAVFSLEIAGGAIRNVSSVVNPDKLGHVGPLADYAGLMEKMRRRG